MRFDEPVGIYRVVGFQMELVFEGRLTLCSSMTTSTIEIYSTKISFVTSIAGWHACAT